MRMKRRSLLGIASTLLFSVFVLFIVIRLGRTNLGPTLRTDGLHDGAVLDTSLLRVHGSTDPKAELSVNGAPVIVAPNGTFAHDVVLHPGYNVLVVETHDDLEHSKTTAYNLYLHEEDPAVAVSSFNTRN